MNQRYPDISVILPVFNCEQFIKTAIDSILFQTYQDFELIILNDGSTDATEKIIHSFDDERIKNYKSRNYGIVYQLNKGIYLAQGEFIARMDADDISHPDRFKKQIEYLSVHKEIVAVGTNYYMINEDTKIINKKQAPPSQTECGFMAPLNSPILHPTLMIKKEVLQKIGGYDEKYNLIEDYELFNRLISNGYKLANVNEFLFYYRIYMNSINSQKEKYQQVKIYDYGSKLLKSRIKHNHSTNKHRVYFQLLLLEYYLGSITLSRKYFLKLLLIKPLIIFQIIRYLPLLILGNKVARFLREKKILFKINYFINSKLNIDLQRLFR